MKELEENIITIVDIEKKLRKLVKENERIKLYDK